MKRPAKKWRRDQGGVLHWVVIATCIAVASLVVSSAASVGPFQAEQKRLRYSDEALVLADSAVALARAELETGAPLAKLPRTALGRGHIAFDIEKADGEDVVIVARGSVDGSLVGGKGTTLVRRIRAHFRVSGKAVSLVESREL